MLQFQSFSGHLGPEIKTVRGFPRGKELLGVPRVLRVLGVPGGAGFRGLGPNFLPCPNLEEPQTFFPFLLVL